MFSRFPQLGVSREAEKDALICMLCIHMVQWIILPKSGSYSNMYLFYGVFEVLFSILIHP